MHQPPRSSGVNGTDRAGPDRATDASGPRSLSATQFASAVTAITSAFGDPTRRQIYLFAHADADAHGRVDADGHGESTGGGEGGITAALVAEHFDLHPNVARHHLDKLAAGGYLEVNVRRDGKPGAGRPSKRYRPTGKQIAVEVPVRQDDVLITLLGRALALLPREQAEAMAEEVGADYGRVMARSLGDTGDHQRSFRSALHAVADALTAHGFAAHAEKRNNELRIVSENCPFGGAAIENPVICAVDRGMVKGMLSALYGDTVPALESSVMMGDARCVTGVTASVVPSVPVAPAAPIDPVMPA